MKKQNKAEKIKDYVLLLDFMDKIEIHKPFMDEFFAECRKARIRAKRKLIVDPLAEKQRLKEAQQISKPV